MITTSLVEFPMKKFLPHITERIFTYNTEKNLVYMTPDLAITLFIRLDIVTYEHVIRDISYSTPNMILSTINHDSKYQQERIGKTFKYEYLVLNVGNIGNNLYIEHTYRDTGKLEFTSLTDKGDEEYMMLRMMT